MSSCEPGIAGLTPLTLQRGESRQPEASESTVAQGESAGVGYAVSAPRRLPSGFVTPVRAELTPVRMLVLVGEDSGQA